MNKIQESKVKILVWINLLIYQLNNHLIIIKVHKKLLNKTKKIQNNQIILKYQNSNKKELNG